MHARPTFILIIMYLRISKTLRDGGLSKTANAGKTRIGIIKIHGYDTFLVAFLFLFQAYGEGAADSMT